MSDETRDTVDEGLKLAFGAINETLQLQTSVLMKMQKAQDDAETKAAEEAKKKEEEDKFEKMVDAISKAMAAKGAFLKKDDTKEKQVDIAVKPENAQKIIQASADEISDKKALNTIAIEKAGGDMTGKNEDATEVKQAEEVKEKKDEKGKEYPEVEEMKKAIATLTKELQDMKKGYSADVKKGVEDKMKSIGWREEKIKTSPVKVEKSIGAEGDQLNLSKSEEDRIAVLAKLPYSELRKLEEKNASGMLEPGFSQLLGR